MSMTSAGTFQPNRPVNEPRQQAIIKEVAGDLTEVCVTCGEETPYKQNTHIDLREHYVEGAGQLCKSCWDDTYNKGPSLING